MKPTSTGWRPLGGRIDRTGVAAEAAFAFVDDHVVLAAEQPCSPEAGDAGADDGNFHLRTPAINHAFRYVGERRMDELGDPLPAAEGRQPPIARDTVIDDALGIDLVGQFLRGSPRPT